MNLIEAIKTGKRIRRKLWAENLGEDTWILHPNHWNFLNEDILADDWEVYDMTVTVTLQQFDSAWDRALEKYNQYGNSALFKDLLTKELGL